MNWTKEKIEKYCKEIKGKFLKDLIPLETLNATKKSNKGSAGNLIEKEIFKLNSGNQSIPDFENLGIELKCAPLKMLNKKNKDNLIYAPKERVSLMNLNFENVVSEINFFKSHLFEKCKHILFIFYLHSNKLEECKIIDYYFYNLEKDRNINIINDEYNVIVKKIQDGLAHLLSESDTKLLGASTTGSGHEKDYKKQPFSKTLAKARRFSFKPQQIRNILKIINIKSTNDILDDLNNKLKPYFNKTINELMEICDIKKINKSIKSKIICSLLKVNNYKEYVSGFDINKIMFKNIEYVNNKIKEEIGLIDVNFDEFNDKKINDFYESEFYDFISDLSILFINWKTENNITYLESIKLFQIDDKMLNDAKFVWDNTKELFLSSKCIKCINNSKYEYNFIKKSDNKTFHIRPHDQKRINRFKMPNGKYLCKFQYWLNKNII